jgi:TfoX/Sxy family transcriptional regulator of competence genes
MAYDGELADRVRRRLADRDDYEEKAMFGGLAFMLHGNMACGVLKDGLILRLGKEGALGALKEPYTRVFDFTGRVSTTMVVLEPQGCADDEALGRWVSRAESFADTLPPK